jgi:hypothetical protein
VVVVVVATAVVVLQVTAFKITSFRRYSK